MRDAARMHHGGADVIDQLILDQVPAVPDRIEHFSDRDGCHGMLPDQPECVLVFRRCRVFHPEQPIRLQTSSEARGFDRRQAMMDVVQQVYVESDLLSQPREQRRHEIEIFLGAPDAVERTPLLRRLVI